MACILTLSGVAVYGEENGERFQAEHLGRFDSLYGDFSFFEDFEVAPPLEPDFFPDAIYLPSDAAPGDCKTTENALPECQDLQVKIDENLLVKVSESLPELPDFYKVEVEKVLSLMHKEQLQPDETLNLMRGLRGIIEQLKIDYSEKKYDRLNYILMIEVGLGTMAYIFVRGRVSKGIKSILPETFAAVTTLLTGKYIYKNESILESLQALSVHLKKLIEMLETQIAFNAELERLVPLKNPNETLDFKLLKFNNEEVYE